MEFVKYEEILVYSKYLLYWIGILALIYIFWNLFVRKFNYVKDHTDFDYENHNGRNDKKKSQINLALRRRKIGELPPPYPNSWFAILESDELERGQVREVYALGKNLVAWRGEKNGTAFVSDAYCPHLGSHLGRGGNVTKDCIECPFHKWTFDGVTGKLENIPYSTSWQNNQNKGKFGSLTMWETVETNGYIYIWNHVDKNKPPWHPEDINDILSGKWKYHGRSEFQVTCHIQEIPENGADVAHLNALHDTPAIFWGRLGVLNDIVGRIVKHKWSADWSISKDPKRSHESRVNIVHSISMFGGKINFLPVNVVIKQIGAGIVIMDFCTPFGKGTLIQCVTPIEPLLQKITHRFYSESRLFHPFALLILQSEAIQISRDIKIWNRKCFLKQPLLVKEDRRIKEFRQWFSQFYSEPSS